MHGAVVEHRVDQVLEGECGTAAVAGQDRQRGRQATARAHPQDPDPARVDPQLVRLAVQPHQARVAVLDRAGVRRLRRQAVVHRDHHGVGGEGGPPDRQVAGEGAPHHVATAVQVQQCAARPAAHREGCRRGPARPVRRPGPARAAADGPRLRPAPAARPPAASPGSARVAARLSAPTPGGGVLVQHLEQLGIDERAAAAPRPGSLGSLRHSSSWSLRTDTGSAHGARRVCSDGNPRHLRGRR